MNKVRLPDTCIRDETEHGKEYVLLADVRTYGDQRAAEARELMREECLRVIEMATFISPEQDILLYREIKGITGQPTPVQRSAILEVKPNEN